MVPYWGAPCLLVGVLGCCGANMKRMIIILVLLLVAVPGLAQELPAEYICAADPSEPLEAEFCARFQVALANTGYISFDPVLDGQPYFHIIVLPTVRDGYLSVAVASNFMYPPLDGLALSAYLSGFIIIPGGVTDENIVQIALRVLHGTAEWMQATEGDVMQIPVGGLGGRVVLETGP